MQRVRRKVTINFTTGPTVVENMDNSIEEHDYSSRSEYISIAISEKLIKEELEAIDVSIDLFLSSILSDSRVMYRLLELIPDDTNFKIQALKKKAKACIELREFGEAIKCLQSAKELTISTKKHGLNKNDEIIVEDGTIENENTEL